MKKLSKQISENSFRFSPERLVLLLLAAIQFLHIIDFMIMMPLGSGIMKRFQISPQSFSLLVSAYTFTAGASALLASLFVDRFDRKKTLLFVLAGFTLGTLACGLAPTYWILLIARCVAGAFGGLLGALVLAIVGDLVPPERRGAAMGLVMASFSAASVVGVPFGLYLARFFDWHAPFIALAILAVPVWLLSLKFIPAINTHIQVGNKPKIWLVFENVFNNKPQQRGLLFMVLLMLGQFTIIPFIAPYMELNVGVSANKIPLIYFFGGLFTIFTSPIFGKLADKHGKNKIYTIFALLTLLPIFAVTNMRPLSLVIVLLVTTFFFVVSTGRMIPAQAMILSTVPPTSRGSFMSLNSAVQQIGAGLASLIGGSIVGATPNGALTNYNLVGYFALIASLCAIWVGQKLFGKY